MLTRFDLTQKSRILYALFLLVLFKLILRLLEVFRHLHELLPQVLYLLVLLALHLVYRQHLLPVDAVELNL